MQVLCEAKVLRSKLIPQNAPPLFRSAIKGVEASLMLTMILPSNVTTVARGNFQNNTSPIISLLSILMSSKVVESNSKQFKRNVETQKL